MFSRILLNNIELQTSRWENLLEVGTGQRTNPLKEEEKKTSKTCPSDEIEQVKESNPLK